MDIQGVENPWAGDGPLDLQYSIMRSTTSVVSNISVVEACDDEGYDAVFAASVITARMVLGGALGLCPEGAAEEGAELVRLRLAGTDERFSAVRVSKDGVEEVALTEEEAARIAEIMGRAGSGAGDGR